MTRFAVAGARLDGIGAGGRQRITLYTQAPDGADWVERATRICVAGDGYASSDRKIIAAMQRHLVSRLGAIQTMEGHYGPSPAGEGPDFLVGETSREEIEALLSDGLPRWGSLSEEEDARLAQPGSAEYLNDFGDWWGYKSPTAHPRNWVPRSFR